MVSVLDKLGFGRLGGVVIDAAGESRVAVSLGGDGADRSLYLMQDASLQVGQVVSFLPV